MGICFSGFVFFIFIFLFCFVYLVLFLGLLNWHNVSDGDRQVVEMLRVSELEWLI